MSALAHWLFLPIDRRALAYPLVYMALIYVLSSISSTGEEHSLIGGFFIYTPPALQNLAHVPLYAALAVLWSRALRLWPMPGRSLFLFACTLTIGYGILDEWHQSFVPGRFSSATDVSLNALGALAGASAYLYALRRRGKTASSLP